MKCQYCGLPLISLADLCLVEALQNKVSQPEIRDKRWPLLAFVLSTQDIPGAVRCDVSHK